MSRDNKVKPRATHYDCMIGKFVLGKFAAEKLYGMEPEKLSNYVVLLNIFNSAGKLEEAAEVVKTLKRKGLRMLPVCSHMFSSLEINPIKLIAMVAKREIVVRDASRFHRFRDGRFLW
ncbi:Pentatricopeptide repeat-containing protein [Abeliophyllum distichum]|uniref:Pentatricopeptide repeat-containing protein n=1 Tax=Abeliophyllum distichum TaxID=126358 RepID=A0ABD1VQI6_9LAMI